MSKAIQEKQDTTLVQMNELSELEGFGTEFQKEELAVPFVSILQSMSPQLKKSNEKHVAAAEEGDLFHTVSNKAYKKLHFIPCKFQHALIQWRDRDAGAGGFVAAYEHGDPDIPANTKAADSQRLIVNDDPTTYLENTLQYICLVFDEEGEPLGPSIISFKSSNLKYARRFNAALQSKMLSKSDGSKFRAPIFSHIYTLETRPERNDRGEWYSFKIGEGEFVKDPSALKDAMAFAESLAEDSKVFVEQDAPEPKADQCFEI